MRKLLTFSLLLLLVEINTIAIPAYPRQKLFIIGNDTISLTLKGDENCKFAIEEQGYTVLQTENGWYYAEEDSLGNVTFSNYKLQPHHKLSQQAKDFLKRTRKGLIPINNQVTSTHLRKAHSNLNIKNTPVTGSRKALVILMQFRDTKLTKSKNDFVRLFNEAGYTEDGAKGSVYDFYQWASFGQLELHSDILGPYTTQNNMSYYGGNTGIGGNDKNPYDLFIEAINNAAQEINLSEYDADEDGVVDNVHIVYAGYGEEAGASSNAIWAHQMTFPAISLQGMKIEKYSCSPELRENRGTGISRIGVHCHELGHALGAMDYYDTDYETGGEFLGTGQWDIMAQGSWNNEGVSPAGFNPYVIIYDFGWTEAQPLQVDTINTICPSTKIGNIYRVDTGVKDDFFLLENRDGLNFHEAEPGKGLLVFHIGPKLGSKAKSNSINSTYPQQCYVVCASSTYQKTSSSASTYGKINSDGCPFPGTSYNTEFNDNSTPAALTVNGENTGIQLTNIAWDNENITLYYGQNNPEEEEEDKTVNSSWMEDFEDMKIPSTWSYEDIIGKGGFSVRTVLSGTDSPQSPTAASGKGYAIYSPLSQNIIGRYSTRGKLKTSNISLQKDQKYQISLKVRKYARLQGATDSLIVHLYNKDENVTHKLIDIRINNQDDWVDLTTDIPEHLIDFSIELECNIDYGSIMFIDDIKIINQLETTLLPTHSSSTISYPVYNGLYVNAGEDTEISVITLDGMYLYKQEMKCGSSKIFILKPGIYVVSIGNKKRKFYIY